MATVALSWTQSPTAGITGNNVYRGTVSGGPYSKIAALTSPATSYSDSVGPGTYYYVVTALVGSNESANSNEFKAVAAVAAPSGLTGTVT